MKIRTGFVSNSSTSSFMAYGTDVDIDEVAKALGREEAEVWDVEDLLRGTRLQYSAIDGCCILVGTHPSDADDSMTLGEFKKQVEEDIKKIFGPKPCKWIEEAWMDY